MKKKNLIAAFGILLLLVGIAVWVCSFYYRKSNDNLPTFATIAEMEASDVNSLLIGYKRTQLIEVWGEPDSVQENEDVWKINDTVNLKVNYNNKGEAVICGLIESIEEFSFGEFKNLNFSFLSGAGGWSTELIIAEDGNFKGVYHDSDMGAGSEEYPNGIQYYCAFQGKFTQPIKKEDYIYSTTIESISYKYPVGTEEIKDWARANGADIVMFGHTHRPVIEMDDVIAVNPGSISQPRQENRRPSYMIMEIDKNKELHFNIYYV